MDGFNRARTLRDLTGRWSASSWRYLKGWPMAEDDPTDQFGMVPCIISAPASKRLCWRVHRSN